MPFRMEIAIAIVLVIGFALVAFVLMRVVPQLVSTQVASQAEAQESRLAEREARLQQAQSDNASRQNSDLLRLNEERLKQETARGEELLKARQGEIDRNLEEIKKELLRVREFVTNTDQERAKSISSLAAVTQQSNEINEALRQGTSKLNETLAGGQSRGQWGERMAEDVLRVAGFIEGINYRKQHSLEDGGRPDFTFLLPDERVLHMDVKFPLASYSRFIDASTDVERDKATKDFLRDVKQRITEVTTRSYIDPANGTLDYAIVFIPNEQVYGFIQENDSSLVDFALKNRVVICSPLTLFAVLAVIRQSLENFRLAQRTDEILSVLGNFNKQWDNYKDHMDKLGVSLDRAQKVYSELTTTRTNMLDRQVRKVEELRQADGHQLTTGEEVIDAEITVEALDVQIELDELVSGD